jgi:putative redox protein
MEIHLKRKNKAFHYEATTEANITVNIDANAEIGGEGKGARPMELVLMGLGGCASIDLAMILKKQKQDLTDYEVQISATRNDNVAKNFNSIHLHFLVWGTIEAPKLEKAIELTVTKYCSVILSLSNEIKITTSYEIK